jgi:hypothetical protein
MSFRRVEEEFAVNNFYWSEGVVCGPSGCLIDEKSIEIPRDLIRPRFNGIPTSQSFLSILGSSGNLMHGI